MIHAILHFPSSQAFHFTENNQPVQGTLQTASSLLENFGSNFWVPKIGLLRKIPSWAFYYLQDISDTLSIWSLKGLFDKPLDTVWIVTNSSNDFPFPGNAFTSTKSLSFYQPSVFQVLIIHYLKKKSELTFTAALCLFIFKRWWPQSHH